MKKALLLATLSAALLLPFGVVNAAGPGGAEPGSRIGPERSAGGSSGARPVPPPPRPSPERRVDPPRAEREGPARGIPERDGPRTPRVGESTGADRPGGERVGPVGPLKEGSTVGPDRVAATDARPDEPTKTSLGCIARAPRLALREPTSAGPPPPPEARGAPRARPAPTVYLTRHSLETKIRHGVAVTELEQVYHNRGSRPGEGTWSCPLPPEAAVTGFSIFINGAEHPGRFLSRTAARRIYDETVRRQRDPGLVELMADGSVSVRIFPIPVAGDMRIRMSWAQPLPDSGSARHFLVALSDITPPEAPPLEKLDLDVSLRASSRLMSVLTPELGLKGPSKFGNHWRGRLAEVDYRPSENLEVGYLVDTSSPRLDVRVERAADGTRTFLAVIQAGGEELRDVSLDLGPGRVRDVFPERIGNVAPHSRAFVFGRLLPGATGDAVLHASVGRERAVLTAGAEKSDCSFIGALWARRKIETLYEEWPPEEKATERIVDLAARFGVLTRLNAILAEE